MCGAPLAVKLSGTTESNEGEMWDLNPANEICIKSSSTPKEGNIAYVC